MHAGAESAIQTLKKESDLEGKRFFIVPGDRDAVGGYIKRYIINFTLRRIKAQIIEDSKNFYSDIYERCKNENKKLSKQPCDKKLKLELKKSFICEIQGEYKRAKKHYDVAYQTVISLSDTHRENFRS